MVVKEKKLGKKAQLVFQISILLNILLSGFVAWQHIKINFITEQVFVTEVQHNLVELEGLIAKQISDNWSEPNLVTTQLGDVLDGIWLGIAVGEKLGALSQEDKDILNSLYNKLNQYPKDELYRFVALTQQDKENFEKLREALREAGLGINISVSADLEYFMNQAAKLEKNIEVPTK